MVSMHQRKEKHTFRLPVVFMEAHKVRLGASPINHTPEMETIRQLIERKLLKPGQAVQINVTPETIEALSKVMKKPSFNLRLHVLRYLRDHGIQFKAVRCVKTKDGYVLSIIGPDVAAK